MDEYARDIAEDLRDSLAEHEKDPPPPALRYVTCCDQGMKAVLDALDSAESKLGKIQSLVNEQAEDEGLWFKAVTAPEAYLQQELRKLHAAIEAPK
jgi:hypothetical protein